MRSIELVPGIRSSVLGFGCAPILGAVEAKRAQRALDCAIDCGITHFDLARSYGYGEAEEFVGSVVKNRRQHLVLASKFGIQANWKARLLTPLKPLVRLIRDKRKTNSNNSSTQIISAANVGADHFHNRIPLRSVEMRNSLEKSLKALKTDYLDYFFVHEPQERIVYLDELIETAEILKKEGKIRAWGLAYMRSQEYMHESYLDQFDVLQFNNSFGASGYENTIKKRGLKPNILFSPLRDGAKEIKASEKLQNLLIDFPKSVVLCSMFSEQHIRENTSLLL